MKRSPSLAPTSDAISRPRSGPMAQAGHAAPADSFVPGDVKTARLFGRHFAQSLSRVMVLA